MKVFSSVLVALAAMTSHVVDADFGDTVDPTFECPALTTCAQVCVSAVEDCPIEMRCPSSGNTTLQLCADGSCQQECNDDELESPCAFECAPVACNRIDDTYDQCQEKYGDLYNAENVCGEEELFYETTLLRFNEPAFIFGYTWVAGLSFLIVVWCAYNQKIAPVEGSTKSLQIDPQDSHTDSFNATQGEGDLLHCTQTGYKVHPLGMLLYVLTLATYAGWSAVLCFLTIQYYVWNEQPQLQNRNLHFEDEIQLLKTFIIVWSVGFVWCFSLKWPMSIKSLFLRRCPLYQATHVAVFLNNGQDEARKSSSEAAAMGSKWMSCLMKGFGAMFHCVNVFMAFVFSDTNWHLRKEGVYEYCKVKTEKDGTRSFTFLFRRYNYCVCTTPADNKASIGSGSGNATERSADESTEKNAHYSHQGIGVFIPGSWSVAETLEEISALGETKTGLTDQDVDERKRVLGSNTIEMVKPTFLRALRQEFAKPFYTYQMFLIWTWFPLYYYYMAMIIAFTVASSAVVVAFFHYRNLRNLYKITHITGQAQVLRNGQWVTVSQKALVPGDIVKLESGITYCDMVLISGDNVLVDESALTGEATPQVKMSVDANAGSVRYLPYIHKRHTVSAGTTILEAEQDSTALVMKTASYTAKGELLREIFAFRRHTFKFDTEVYIVLGILILMAVFCFSITIYLVDDIAVTGWFYAMYVVAAAIPPLLPTTFTVSVGVSDARLANKRVACSNSESILIAGKVTRAFFDKTGTLTKQGLDFKSARSAENWQHESISDNMKMAMASCHSVTFSSTGQIVGNPVDRTMFSVSGATLDGSGSATLVTDGNGNKLEVVRHFDFDHNRMTMSVIVKLPDETYVAFVKGSGESVRKICLSSTIPSDFDNSVTKSATNGIYQISVAMKRLEKESISMMSRDDVESDCSFVGVLNFLNAMREETPGVVAQLTEGGVESVVVTGDNTLNGIRTAKESGIMSMAKTVIIGNVPEDTDSIVWTAEDGSQVPMPTVDELGGNHIQLAMSGKAWLALRTQNPKLANSTAPFVKVFGRCTPFDKVSVVDTFVELGFITMMCGDGGNDCGALKAAHVGVALSDAEASIVSPFTSLDRAIGSVVEVLREGRCALASALAVYKFIILYGLITVMNQMIMAYFQATFAEWNWVFIDGVWVICLAYTLPLARSAKKLANTRPTASILGAQTVSSAGGIFLLHFLFTVIALIILFKQDWFQCRQWVPTNLLNALVLGDNYEAQVVWLVTGFQYVSSATAFNFGFEFRRAWWRNWVFALFVIGFTVMHIYIIFVPGKLSCFFRVNCVNENVVFGVTGGGERLPIQNPYNTTMMPEPFRWVVFGIIAANTFAVVVYEYFVVNGIRRRSAAKKAKAMESLSGDLMVQRRGSNYGARPCSVDVEPLGENGSKVGADGGLSQAIASRRSISEAFEKGNGVVSADFSAPGRRKSVFLSDDNLVEI